MPSAIVAHKRRLDHPRPSVARADSRFPRSRSNRPEIYYRKKSKKFERFSERQKPENCLRRIAQEKDAIIQGDIMIGDDQIDVIVVLIFRQEPVTTDSGSTSPHSKPG
jgi:hypothetical protein